MAELSREGHRRRVKDAYLENGLSGMADANVLELILFYAIPRRDTKELAYSLLNHFNGNLEAVLSATPEELAAVDGIGDSAAILLSLFNRVSSRISTQRNGAVVRFDSYHDAKAYCQNLLGLSPCEQTVLITLDNNMRILAVHTVAEGTVNTAVIEPRKLIELALRDKCASVMLTHNHPNGSFIPSPEDMTVTQQLYRLFAALNIRLADHIIVGSDGSLSMKNDVRYAALFS